MTRTRPPSPRSMPKSKPRMPPRPLHRRSRSRNGSPPPWPLRSKARKPPHNFQLSEVAAAAAVSPPYCGGCVLSVGGDAVGPASAHQQLLVFVDFCAADWPGAVWFAGRGIDVQPLVPATRTEAELLLAQCPVT